MRAARKKGTKAKGTYAMSIPKKASSLLRNITRHLKTTKSILIIISQTRDNINPMSFETKTRSGGRALKFYAFHEIWLAVAGKIKKDINKRKRTIGMKVKVKVTKNKETGKSREVEFSIYNKYGVDDIRSCIQYLINEKYWTKTKQTINAEQLNIRATEQKLIEEIESRGLERKLKRVVGKCWQEIEDQLNPNRKPRYS